MRKIFLLMFFVITLNEATAQLFPWCPFYKPIIKRELSVLNTPQEGMSWCWLAAIQMSLDYNLCMRKSQCELVAKTFPSSEICCPICCLDSAQCLTENIRQTTGDCTEVVLDFTAFKNKSSAITTKFTNSKSAIVNSFQNMKNITNEFANNNAVILINKTSRNPTFLPTGLHAVIGAGIINKKGLDSFLIIQDPFAPCKGCKYWINTKCYDQPKVHYFTKFEKEVLVIKDPNNACVCTRSTNTCITNTELLALKILDSINIDLSSTITRYGLTKTPKTQYDKAGKELTMGLVLSYKNDFFIVLQDDGSRNEEIEVGFCPYILEKTVEAVNKLYKISLQESSGTLPATLLSFEDYPSDFYSFYITINGVKERFLSPTNNDFKLNLSVGKGYKFEEILNKLNKE